MTSEFVPTASALLPAMRPRAELALLARVLWREGYGRDPDARIVARDDAGARRSTSGGVDWRRLVAGDVECAHDEPGPGPAFVELRDRPRYGALWAAIGEIPPPMDQSSTAGGGVPGVHLCIAPGGVVVVRGGSVRSVHERAVAFEARCRHAWMVRAAGAPLDPPLPAAYRGARELLDGNGFVGFWEAMVRQELRADPGLLATLTEEG